MSLINEALKKAQGDRPVQPGPGNVPGGNPPGQGHYTPPPKKNRKNFLWGFILAVFIVGSFSILLSTYFVLKILGPEEDAPEVPREVAQTPEVPAPKEAASESPLPEKEESPVPESVPVAQTQPSEEPELEEAPEPGRPALPPDPAVIARLRELEIRGIMSGGTRVLIFDQASGRNKAYRAGDSLEGPMGLIVENISSSSIKFKDYAGQTHTKSF